MFEHKILLLCEGKNEEKILNILLENDSMVFDKDDLIAGRPIPLPSNIRTPFVISEVKHYGNLIDIVRVKDSEQDKITIPREIKHLASKDRVYDYCTKPAIEMLLIYNEGLLEQYNKVKSKIDPKNFAKQNIVYNGKKYDNSTEFYEMYYTGESNIGKLEKNIKGYKGLHKNKKGEGYLADLLK